VPVGIAHAGANRHDQRLLTETLESIPIERPEAMSQAPRGVCLDRAYDAPPIYALAEQHGFTVHIRTRGEEIADKLRHPRLARPPLGHRGLPLVAEPQPRDPDSLVQEGREPPRPAATVLRPDRVQESPRAGLPA
jgi:hypothetical protein